jgi:hypothetical protein
MPLCKCPTCDSLFDFHVADTRAWRADKWPDYSATELAPELCPLCEKEEHGRRLEFGELNTA